MDQTLMQNRNHTGKLRIPFSYGTCPENSNSSQGTSYSKAGTASLHERVPEPDTETRSSSGRPVRRNKANIMAASCAPPHSDQIVVQLRDHSLWNSFRNEETEMIITKAGRRMFPFLDFSLSGLEPDQYYSCAVEIVSADSKRYRYHKAKGWTGSGGFASPADPKYCLFVHTNSASLGRYWMEQGANFERMKVSNHFVNGSGHIVLASMQKYKARLRLTKLGAHACEHWLFDFPETEFVTVTSYQNPRMTKLKIDNNPFAKAFRNGKRSIRNQDGAEQSKRRCSRFSSPPPITRYQSPFISFLNGQEAPAPASIPAPALPSPPPLAPALPPPPLSHEPFFEEPFSARYVPVWNDATLPWEPFEDLMSARRHTLPSMSASFKVEVCGTYTQKPETSCALSHFEDEFRAPLFGGLFDEVQMPVSSYAPPYDRFWREV